MVLGMRNELEVESNMAAVAKAHTVPRELWLEAQTHSGLAFGRVLCPHISLALGQRAAVPLQDIGTLCASVTFNNCEVRVRTLIDRPNLH